MCNQLINAVGNISATVTSGGSTNFYNKEARYKTLCYILHMVSSADCIAACNQYSCLSLCKP